MPDIIEKLHGSLIQHGKESNRVYLMKLNVSRLSDTLDIINELAKDKGYSKILAKIPAEFKDIFEQDGFAEEAYIPKFYKGKSDCSFMCKYFSKERKLAKNAQEINEIINISKQKEYTGIVNLLTEYKFEVLNPQDIPQMTKLYREVFDNYPFPIFEDDYILKTMKDNVCYFGVKNSQGELISISSAEMDKENLNAEMTDYATLPIYRGQGFALYLLKQMEQYLVKNNFKTAYTIARAVSAGMNITFAKNDYIFSGTLINNSNISSGIESMNVWYKNLE